MQPDFSADELQARYADELGDLTGDARKLAAFELVRQVADSPVAYSPPARLARVRAVLAAAARSPG